MQCVGFYLKNDLKFSLVVGDSTSSARFSVSSLSKSTWHTKGAQTTYLAR
jgi:hypothetical protein